jgi:hypothetical protein
MATFAKSWRRNRYSPPFRNRDRCRSEHARALKFDLRSPTYTQSGCRRARRRAFRSVGRAARTNQTGQHLVVLTANSVRTGDNANWRRWAGITLRTCRARRPCRTGGALRSGRAAFAAGSSGALSASLPLRTLRSDWS